MAAASEFDRLFTIRVPHIHEKIFFSLDYKSFKNSLEVSKSWNDLLTSESFLRMGKSVFCEDIQKEILRACVKGDVDIIQRVLSSFMVDLNFTNHHHSGPLILAVGYGHKDVVHLLLDKGAQPNMGTDCGLTPLHVAVSRDRKDIVQLLLDRGAEPNMKDFNRRTPLFIALHQGGQTDIANLLTEYGGALFEIRN